MVSLAYPEGDVAKPRPVIPFGLLWNGYPAHKFPETQHWRELELMRQLQPGEFTVLRKDAATMKVTVKAEKDPAEKVTRLVVEFPISREDKPHIPPMSVVLYQLVHPDNPQRRFVEAMQEYFEMVFPTSTPALVPA